MSDMQITDVSTFEQRAVTLNIEGGPIVTKRHGKRQFRVERLTLNYSCADGGVWRWGTTHVGGPYVLKDGSTGEGTGDSYWDKQALAELGLWVFAETYLPVPS